VAGSGVHCPARPLRGREEKNDDDHLRSLIHPLGHLHHRLPGDPARPADGAEVSCPQKDEGAGLEQSGRERRAAFFLGRAAQT